MEPITILRTTGAVRRFTADGVPDATLHAVLDDARFAPSGGNRQPWRVAVVGDPTTRRALASLMQAVWDAYMARAQLGIAPFNVVDDQEPATIGHADNELLDNIESIPIVLAIAADLRRISLMDGDVGRIPMTAGASIYPFCWNILLSARAHGLGGVMTTFLSRAEADAGPMLGLPEHHALVATIFLGVPQHQPTALRRRDVDSFATVDRFDGAPFTV